MIEYASITRPGDRPYNEDCIEISQKANSSLYVLADGLGGQGKGDIASKVVCDTAKKIHDQYEREVDDNLIDEIAEQSHNNIIKKKSEDGIVEDMMSTMVTLVIGSKTIHWGNVGDSRLYYFKNKELVKRTIDHSVPQVLVSTGEITEDQIRYHKDRNRLLKAEGMLEKEGKLNSNMQIERTPELQFLLCSDGFWEHIEEKDMVKFLKKAKTPKDWLDRMEKVVLKNGRKVDMDNYSAVAVFC